MQHVPFLLRYNDMVASWTPPKAGGCAIWPPYSMNGNITLLDDGTLIMDSSINLAAPVGTTSQANETVARHLSHHSALIRDMAILLIVLVLSPVVWLKLPRALGYNIGQDPGRERLSKHTERGPEREDHLAWAFMVSGSEGSRVDGMWV